MTIKIISKESNRIKYVIEKGNSIVICSDDGYQYINYLVDKYNAKLGDE